MCLKLGRPAEALASFDRAALLAPQQFDVHFQRGVALALLERHHESLASFSTAVILNPDSAEAVGNRGAVLVRLFRPAEALPDFARAVVLKPDYADAFLNAGIARRGLGRYREALDDLDRALSIRPEDPTAAWMKALLHLALREVREGLPLYDSRAQLPHARQLQRTLPGTRWTGTEPLAGRTLLVYADQGLGDTLQFCRYIPMLEALGANVVFEVQPVLKPLLGSLAMRGTLIGRGEALPEFDLHIPLLSVPLAVRTELDCIPGGVPYLRVPPAAIRWWGERLAALPGLKVGLHWCGNPEAAEVAALEARSFPLTAAAALDRKSTRLNSSHSQISYAVFCLEKHKLPTGLVGARHRRRRPRCGLPGVLLAGVLVVRRAADRPRPPARRRVRAPVLPRVPGGQP